MSKAMLMGVCKAEARDWFHMQDSDAGFRLVRV